MSTNYLGRFGSVVFTVLIVTSLVGPMFAGVASANSVYTKTVSGSPEYVGIDLEGVDASTVNIQITASRTELPTRNQDTVIMDETVGTGYAVRYFVLENKGAYESVDVRVSVPDTGTGSPVIGTDSEFSYVVKQRLAATGGDADLDCDWTESLASSVVPIIDCKPLPTQGINTTALSAAETEAEIYSQALTLREGSDQYFVNYDNTVQHLEIAALREGKIAYLNAFNNGSSESVARTKALDAVRDFWTEQQLMMVDSFERQATVLHHLNDKEEAHTGVSSAYVNVQTEASGGSTWNGMTENTFTATLVNGSTASYLSIGDPTVNAPEFYIDRYEYSGSSTGNTYAIEVEGNADTGPMIPFLSQGQHYHTRWADLESRNSQTVAEMDTYVNQTWTPLVGGEINATDVVNSYDARRLGPEDGYQTWALHEIGRVGLATPSTLNTTGSFDVSLLNATDGTVEQSYNGIILSDGLPQGDTFDVGTVYNTGNLTGPQLVVTDTETHQLPENRDFRIESATNKDGTTETAVGYKNITYREHNLTSFKEEIGVLTDLINDINERQEEASSDLGGGSTAVVSNGFLAGLFDSLGFAGVPGEAVALGGGAAAAYGLSMRGGSGGLGGSRRRR